MSSVTSFSSINLFIRNWSDLSSPKCTKILGQFKIKDKNQLGKNLSFSVSSANYEEIKALFISMIDNGLLDEDKRSQATIFGEDGLVRCITTKDEELVNLNH